MPGEDSHDGLGNEVNGHAQEFDNNVVSIKEILLLVMCSHLQEERKSWLSKLQTALTLFTIEAEYMIAIQACNAKVIGELKQN